jgi:thiol-disulfide isomerase/thioredoxin
MKRVYKFLVVSVIILVVGYISYKIYSGIKGKNEVIKKREVLPFHCLYSLNETQAGLKGIKKSDSYVLIFFSPDCDHCVYEIESIIQKADSFINVNIYLVSSQPLKILNDISEHYTLHKYPQIEVLYADYQCIRSVYGIILLPTTFIYNRDFRLTKIFRGETGASAILKATGSK